MGFVLVLKSTRFQELSDCHLQSQRLVTQCFNFCINSEQFKKHRRWRGNPKCLVISHTQWGLVVSNTLAGLCAVIVLQTLESRAQGVLLIYICHVAGATGSSCSLAHGLLSPDATIFRLWPERGMCGAAVSIGHHAIVLLFPIRPKMKRATGSLLTKRKTDVSPTYCSRPMSMSPI